MFVPMHATFDVSSLRSWNIPLHFVRCTESALFRADVKVEDKTSENEHLIPSLKWKKYTKNNLLSSSKRKQCFQSP